MFKTAQSDHQMILASFPDTQPTREPMIMACQPFCAVATSWKALPGATVDRRSYSVPLPQRTFTLLPSETITTVVPTGAGSSGVYQRKLPLAVQRFGNGTAHRHNRTEAIARKVGAVSGIYTDQGKSPPSRYTKSAQPEGGRYKTVYFLFCCFSKRQILQKLLDGWRKMLLFFHCKPDLAIIRLRQGAYLEPIGNALQNQIGQNAHTHSLFDHRHNRKVLPCGKANVWLCMISAQQIGNLGFASVLEQ